MPPKGSYRKGRKSTKSAMKALFKPTRTLSQMLRPRIGNLEIVRRCPVNVMYSGTTGASTWNTTNGLSENQIFLGTPVVTYAGSNIYNVPFTMVFRFDQLQNYTELTAIADQYQIRAVKVQFKMNDYTNYASGQKMSVFYTKDGDDRSIALISDLRQKMDLKQAFQKQGSNISAIIFKPKPATVTYTSIASVGNGYAQSNSKWYDSTYPNIEHYGIKGYISGYVVPNAVNVNNIEVDVTMCVGLKGVE